MGKYDSHSAPVLKVSAIFLKTQPLLWSLGPQLRSLAGLTGQDKKGYFGWGICNAATTHLSSQIFI